jgi:thioredoxin reductase
MLSKSTGVIIIGAGPAGIACAIQLKRYNIDYIVLEKDEIGGLLKNANLVENYLGFPNGISGAKLVQLISKQSQINELNIKYECVEAINYENRIFNIKTKITKYFSKYLVIASGTKPNNLDTPVIPNDIKDKVFFEIYKLGQIKNKNIAIIGAGDCAFDYALQLCTHNNVVILNRGKRVKTLPVLQEKVHLAKNIRYLENTLVNQLQKENNNIGIICKPIGNSISIDYLLIAIGREPNLDFISKDLLKNPNVFQIGDVKNGQFRQTSIAVGDGTFTAMNINKILKQEN